MIVITGAGGFIGSCLVGYFNECLPDKQIVAVDDFSKKEKHYNLLIKRIYKYVERDVFFQWIEQNGQEIDFIFHIGARTDTTEFDKTIFDRLNEEFSKDMWNACVKFKIPLVYASSAATYGMGEHGYNDDHQIIEKLKPLNPYGESKNNFDKWVLKQQQTPPFWAGLKFFNVYGPNEYHKNRMASVVFHAYLQITQTKQLKLFRSHNKNYADGQQQRDFIYVKDILKVCLFLYEQKPENGIYNLGSGTARSFLELALAIFQTMNIQQRIEFIDTPADIRERYQYYTQANMSKLMEQGYPHKFFTLEEGVKEYIQDFLMRNKYF